MDLAVFSLDGRQICHLVKPAKLLGAGFYHAVWDGTDDFGNPVASGPYVYRLATRSGFTKARVMIRVPQEHANWLSINCMMSSYAWYFS